MTAELLELSKLWEGGDRYPKFFKSVKSISTGEAGAYYARHINQINTRPPDFQTFLRPWIRTRYPSNILCQKQLTWSHHNWMDNQLGMYLEPI